MIAVDTSALLAVVLGEADAESCRNVLEEEAEVIVSAGTLAEVLIVAAGRNVSTLMLNLIDGLTGLEIVPVTSHSARIVGQAYVRWGKGFHPAGLNFGDCFAYALAIERSCPLLYVGDDFSKTDVRSALSG